VFERWVSSCPLTYRSGNAPDKRDVLGTLMLGLLAGHRRYAHITALRGDAVAAQALGMARVVSEDALRRALERIDEASSAAWMRPSLMHSVREALDRPWVLDIDASIKPLYGRQEGAEIGYNPTKPMRPSHVLHTFLVSHLRLVLDVQVSSGKQHTSGHAKAALGRLLDELGERRPALVRGDSGYGNEGILLDAGRAASSPTCCGCGRPRTCSAWWRSSSPARTGAGPTTRAARWSRPSCNCTAGAPSAGWSSCASASAAASRASGVRRRQATAAGPGRPERARRRHRLWEYAVLVTDVAYPLESIGQLYRDRADAENAFDELKNQWGLGGFTTQDINRCQTVARACALVYNWWSWYCRAAHPTGRLEAITSRPLLLAAVGKAASHANQTTLYLTPLHGRADVLKRLIANIGAALQHVKAAAEQFKDLDRWGCLLRYISDRIAPVIGPPRAAAGAAGGRGNCRI
jgi:hypothetical protein